MSLKYLFKVPAVIVILFAEQIAFNPPRPAPPKSADASKFGGSDYINKLTGWFQLLGKTITFPCHVFDAVGAVAHEFPSELSDRFATTLFKDPSAIDRLAITPVFVFGLLLLAGGAAIRKASYDELGKFFTFQLAIYKDHKLITTGPYAIVRHPAYIGFLMANTGYGLVFASRGTYLRECGMLDNPWVATILGVYFLACLNLQFTTWGRISREDEVLSKEFGTEWEAWAKKTPYKLIPYVY